ncbi:MAG: NAD(P)-dependent oxidoreductase [Candidatus Omnitrophica bacterium]|nr:NAD(P)-dependent oxidoreductase [Candidatus Omnitrophota bacterium]
MKVLITGATGYIGKYLIQTLRKKDYEVYCLVRPTSNITHLQGQEIKFVYGDLTNTSSLFEAVSEMDYIYHLAIAKNPRRISAYYQVNHIGTENLIKACAEHNPHIKKFIYVSSLAAAGFSPDGKPLKESDPPHPVTHYGKSKLKGEEAVLNYKDRLPIVILRPPTVYGPGNMFLDYLINIITKGLKPSWKGYTSLCYIDDFINGLILISENKKSESNIYFISDGKTYSWKEIIDIITRLLNRKTMPLYIPHSLIVLASYVIPYLASAIKKPFFGNKLIELRHLYWISDNSRIKWEFNFQSQFTLEDGLGLTLKNYQNGKRCS